MDQSILQKYNIDPALPPEQVMDLLQSKNLELLERIGNCSDPQRLGQLQSDQKVLEDALMQLSGAISLNRQVASRNAQTGQVSSGGPLQTALLDYQAGNYDAALPVLAEHARQGDPLCCTLAANILLAQDHPREAKEFLYAAADAGNGTAALMLAHQYNREENTDMGIRWAKKAVELQEPESRRLLASLYSTVHQTDQALLVRVEDLETATGYDRRAVLIDLACLLKYDTTSSTVAKQILDRVQLKLEGDALNGEYWARQMDGYKVTGQKAFVSKGSLRLLGWILILGAFPFVKVFPSLAQLGIVFVILGGILLIVTKNR